MFLPEDDANVINSKQEVDPIDRFLWPNLSDAVRHNNSARLKPDSHMTDYFSRHAVKVIEANRHRPFFLYLVKAIVYGSRIEPPRITVLATLILQQFTRYLTEGRGFSG